MTKSTESTWRKRFEACSFSSSQAWQFISGFSGLSSLNNPIPGPICDVTDPIAQRHSSDYLVATRVNPTFSCTPKYRKHECLVGFFSLEIRFSDILRQNYAFPIILMRSENNSWKESFRIIFHLNPESRIHWSMRIIVITSVPSMGLRSHLLMKCLTKYI